MVIEGASLSSAVPAMAFASPLALPQVSYISAHGGGRSVFVPPSGGTAAPMIVSSRGPVSTVPHAYFVQGAPGASGGSSAVGGSGAPAGAGGGGGDDDDRFWWIGARPPSRGEYVAMVGAYGKDGVDCLNGNAMERIQGDDTIGNAEKIIFLTDVLYDKGTQVRLLILRDDEGVVRDEATGGVEDGIHGSLVAQGNDNLQLAAAIALAFHGGVEDAPREVVTALRNGLLYPDRRVQLRTALAMLYDGSEGSLALLTSRWYNLPAAVQDKAIELFIERDDVGRPVDSLLRLHIRLAELRRSKDSEASIAVARRLLNRERFRTLLSSRPEILKAAHRSYEDSFDRMFRNKGGLPSADRYILRSEYTLIGAAVHVVARHPELSGSDIYEAAMDVVAHEIETVVFPRGGPIHDAEYRMRAAGLIPDDDLSEAWGMLLSHPDLSVRTNAAIGIIVRGLVERHALPVSAALFDIFRNHKCLRGLDPDLVTRIAGDRRIADQLIDIEFFDDARVLGNLFELARDSSYGAALAALEAVILYAPLDSLFDFLNGLSVDFLYDGYRFKHDWMRRMLLDKLVVRIANGIDVIGRERVEQFLKDSFSRSRHDDARFIYAAGLAFIGVFDHEGQQDLFRAELRAHMPEGGPLGRDEYVLGRDIDSVPAWELAAIAVARRMLLVRYDIRVHLENLLKIEDRADPRYLFGYNLLIYRLAAERGTGNTFFFGLAELARSDGPDSPVKQIAGDALKEARGFRN